MTTTSKDPSSPIQGVQDTALLVATYRAMETERPDALIRDPLAAALAGERGRQIVRHMGEPKASRWMLAVRTLVIDDFVKAAVASGVDTVLNLGAGLDTRPYRLDLPKTLRWIEADFPDMIAYKEERLRGEIPRCRLDRAAVDLAAGDARRAFLAGVDAEAGRVLVITEGVLPYLTLTEVGALADDLRARPKFAGWIVDYFAPWLLVRRKRMKISRKMSNAPFRFDPPDWDAFFRDHGWKVKEMRYLAHEGALRGRPAPLPWYYRLMMRMAPTERRAAMGKMLGYAVMERT